MADPTLVRGYADRWRASTLTGVDGTLIASWPSDAGLAVEQVTAADQPELRTDAAGRRMVWFDGVSDVLHTPNSIFLNNVVGSTMYWIYRPVTYPATGTQQGFYISTGGSAGATRHVVRIQSGKPSSGGRRLDADAFAAVQGPNDAATTAPTVFTSSADYGNAQISLWVDGNNIYRNSAFQTAGATSPTNPVSLRFCGATASGFSNNEVYEAILYQTVHTDEERAEVHTYIQDTYGIGVADYVVVVSSNDAPNVSVAESSSLAPVEVIGSDNTSASLTETIELKINSSASDSLSAGIADVSEIVTASPGEDIISVSITETASVLADGSATVTGSDSVTPSVTDQSLTEPLLSAADNILSVIAEVTEAFVTLSSSDAINSSLTESGAVPLEVAASDGVTASITDTAAKAVQITASDSLTSSLTDLGSVLNKVKKIKVWNGTAYVASILKVWNGTAWQVPSIYVWDGRQWI